jgi:hypothetical protein
MPNPLLGKNQMSKRRQQPLTILDYQDMVKAYHNESDRAAAVLAGSFAEHFLGMYLRSFMREDIDQDAMFSHGPLATFASRVKLAYAFGLINQQIRDDLNTVKDIRNYFAHTPAHTTFQNKEATNLCTRLSTRDLNPKPRSQFLFAVGLAIGQLHNTMVEGRQRLKKTGFRRASDVTLEPAAGADSSTHHD